MSTGICPPRLRRALRLFGAGALLATLASIGVSCGPPNQDACRNYVAFYNGCHVSDPIDAETQCPATLDATSVDCTGYYDCLTQSQQCVGGQLTGDTSACTGCI